jgi:large conductance mechanosensitive channel
LYLVLSVYPTKGGNKIMLEEFKKFILRGNVLDLAIGVIIGGAFGAIVTSLVNDIIGPIIGLLTGGINLSGQTTAIGPAVFNTGNFVQTIINFLIIGFVLFLIVRAMNKVMPPPPPPPPPGPSVEEQMLAELKKLNSK